MPGSLTGFWQHLRRLFTRAPRDARDLEYATLPDGTRVLLRPLTPEDAPLVSEALRHLSAESRYHRFLAPVERLSPAQLDYLTRVDGVDHIALGVALAPKGRASPRPIAIARSIRDRADPEVAEVAIVVADDWHRRGVGRLLLERLAEHAWHAGIRQWRASMLAENRGAQALLGRVAVAISTQSEGPTVEILYALRPPEPAISAADRR